MAEALKNEISPAFLRELCAAIEAKYPAFRRQSFLGRTSESHDWESRELKQRIRTVADALRENLPSGYREAVEILEEASDGITGLKALVFCDFVEVYGLKNWKASMEAMERFTVLCSAEFAIRSFIEQDPARAFEQLRKWSRSRNEHLRRLSSEGCRPLLPWGRRVKFLSENPDRILELLESLKEDPSRYVQKSVANNLNDLSKLWPEKVLETAEAWAGRHSNTDWIVKHGLRTFLKKGNPRALALFGYRDADAYELQRFALDCDSVRIGGALDFEFTLRSIDGALGRLRVEYVVSYLKSNGSHSEKVFKVGEGDYGESERTWKVNQGFADLSTRKHYEGRHYIELVANGKRLERRSFLLKGNSK